MLDFYQRDIDYYSLEYLPPETFQALRRYEICDGNLYISIAGSIGHVGTLRSKGKSRVVLTENAARIVIQDNSVSEFWAYQMNSPTVQKQIEAKKGTGGGVPKLALFRIEDLVLTFPPFCEQTAIVNILSTHDARIQAKEARLAKLHQIKQGLMADLLTGRVRV